MFEWRGFDSPATNPVTVVSVCQPSCKLTLVWPEATLFSFTAQSEKSTVVDTLIIHNDIIYSFWMQETLEDIDKNGDGHVDVDEYIGEFMSFFE